MTIDRRSFLMDVARLAAMTAVVPNDWRVVHRPRFPDYPFSLGVASGDPTPTSVVLWTRIAPNPLEPEGGMAGLRTAVSWEVAEDEQFARIVKRGRATAAPELSYSIHVDVDGLQPDRWYFYRFTSMDAASPVGRLRTTPTRETTATRLRLGVVSCNHWEAGLYTAYHHLSREELDLVAHLGDYIYEYGPTTNANAPRRHNSPEIQTLEQYRARYALYKSDTMFQAAHARCPWVVTWDDHEVDNNYAGSVGENVWETEEQMRARRAAAYQAWWEHQPVRVPRTRSWADLNIVRTADWGSLARFWMLDSRQFRTEQSCGGGYVTKLPCGNWADPARTMLGVSQETWLSEGLKASKSRWQVLGNQTMVQSIDRAIGPDVGAPMDSWGGYPGAKRRLLDAISSHARNRAVILTGDNHANWANEIRTDANAYVCAEFVGTSISSGGDGSDRSGYFTDAVAAENPHVKWQNNRRGYLVCEVTADLWRTEFRTVAYVTRPDAPVETPTRWRVVNGREGVEREG